MPFLCVRAGDRKQAFIEDDSVWTLELQRGPLSFALEKDLRFDPAYPRYFSQIAEILERFQPDLIHITGVSELGLLGAKLASEMSVPLAASWHTNVHEYAARRAEWLLHLLPARAGKTMEDVALAIAARFYALAKILFAPNPELCRQLEDATGRPCHLMSRGVDTKLFCPDKRRRRADDQTHVLGFVGRLSVEKNIAGLVRVQDELERMGRDDFRFLIVGHGRDEAWLRERLHRGEFTGVLRGEELATAYASMDLFVFPSHTDTFGNVVLESLASGVPAVVTPGGGPKTIVRDGVTGRIAPYEQFTENVAEILRDRQLHEAMREAARAYALTASWDRVFEGVYATYGSMFPGQLSLISIINS